MLPTAIGRGAERRQSSSMAYPPGLGAASPSQSRSPSVSRYSRIWRRAQGSPDRWRMRSRRRPWVRELVRLARSYCDHVVGLWRECFHERLDNHKPAI